VSSFEFVLVSIAIILGFGISEVLAGWGRQLRHRHQVRPYPLQIVASAYVLFLSLRYLWVLWFLREAEWTFASYGMSVLPALALALAAHVVRSDPESLRRTPKQQYFDAARPFYGLVALFPVLSLAAVPLHAEHMRERYGAATDPMLLLAWGLLVGFCAFMAWSRSPRQHAVAWVLLAGFVVLVSSRVGATLGAAP